MKFISCVILSVVLQSKACDKQTRIKIPSCIRAKIEAISRQPKYNPPATVHRYLYGDKYVYLFSADCCDQYEYLYDKDCNVICAPAGGITGRGDGGCSNFKQVATDETLIWRDTR